MFLGQVLLNEGGVLSENNKENEDNRLNDGLPTILSGSSNFARRQRHGMCLKIFNTKPVGSLKIPLYLLDWNV